MIETYRPNISTKYWAVEFKGE